jgi:hypothetical protein
MRTYDTQPLVSTFRTPAEIIGGSRQFKIFSEIIAIHERAAKTGIAPGRNEFKTIDRAALSAFPAILAELRANGFYPNGVNEQGNCRFQQARKSKAQEVYEAGLGDLAGYTVEDFQGMARSGYRQIVKQIEVPKVQRHEINAQAYR